MTGLWKETSRRDDRRSAAQPGLGLKSIHRKDQPFQGLYLTEDGSESIVREVDPLHPRNDMNVDCHCEKRTQ